MTDAIVTSAEVATTLLRPAPVADSVDDLAWTMWIGDALLQIRNHFADDGLTLDDLDQDNLKYVVREAVAAKAGNPQGLTQKSISLDDGTVSRTYSTATGTVSITDAWWALLTPTPEDNESPGAFTINPTARRPRALDAGY